MQHHNPDDHTYFVYCTTTLPYAGNKTSFEHMLNHAEQELPALADIIEDVEYLKTGHIKVTACDKVYCEDFAALRDSWEDDHPGTGILIHSVQNVVYDGELLGDVLHAEKTNTKFVA